MRIPFSARLCTSSATRGIVTPVNGESPTGAYTLLIPTPVAARLASL